MVIRQTSKKIESPQPIAVDDFTTIHGIGSGIEARLHKAGISTYAQLAELTVDQIAEILKDVVGMTPKRISDQDWIAQAKKLRAEKPAIPVANQDDFRQHYEMFSVELLLDEMNQVRRTKIVHSQSKAEVSWAGWNVERLLDTIIQDAGLRQVPAQDVTTEQRWTKLKDHIEEKTNPKENRSVSPVEGELALNGLEVLMEGMNKPSSILNQEQPYRVNLTLDMSKVVCPPDSTMEYQATVYARDPGGANQYIVGTTRGVISQAEKVTIQIDGVSLPVGVYRLEAVVSLGNPGGQPLPGSGLMAMLEAGLLQIF